MVIKFRSRLGTVVVRATYKLATFVQPNNLPPKGIFLIPLVKRTPLTVTKLLEE